MIVAEVASVSDSLSSFIFTILRRSLIDCVAVAIADDVTEQEREEESHVMIFYCLSCPVSWNITSMF